MHVYFSGIGGVGIGPLAMLALDAGYTVSGSDLHESDMTTTLRKRGAEVYIGQDGTEVSKAQKRQPIEWFVYSSALPKDHPELRLAKDNHIKMSKRAEFINLILKEKDLKLVAVSGTHGKTTTTGMLIWLFKQLGLPVSYSVGTTLSFGPAAQYRRGSEYFIYECDEFDRNFLEFHPELSLVVSMDYDHPDTYPTEASYVKAFRMFAEQSKLCVTWEPIAEKLKSDADLFVVPEDRDFELVQLAGLHNRQNAWLAATAINRLELVKNTLDDWHMLLEKVSSFPGTNRRFEKLAENLYTDYAHHPAEIAATIQMAKERSKNVVVVYQPHQNIRQHELVDAGAYGDCFKDATTVYWLPTYLSREDKDLPVLSNTDLIKSVGLKHTAHPAEMDDDLGKKIKGHLANGDLVVAMSAGSLDHWLRESVAKY